MNMEQSFNNERGHHGDPNAPFFRFTGADRERKIKELKAQGVADENIEAELKKAEAVVMNKLAQDKYEREKRKAA